MEKQTTFNLLKIPVGFWSKVKQISAIQQKSIRQLIMDLLESEIEKYKNRIG